MFFEFWAHLGAAWRVVLAGLEIVALTAGLGHVILCNRDARAAAFWAVLIIFVPVLGALFYVLFGINRVRRSGIRFRKVAVAGRSAAGKAVPSNPWERHPELTGLRRLAATLSKISPYEFALGNRVLVYADGESAMLAMLEAIRGARTSLTLGTYIFEARGVGGRFVEELVAAKARGVEVRVMVDGAGTRYSWPPVTRLLAERGIRVARFMPHRFWTRLLTLNLRNHRKVMVADGEIGFTGGINIRPGNMLSENPRSPVRDMHFRIEGPVVRQLQRGFAEDWAFCAREVLSGGLWYPDLEPRGEVAAIGLPDGPEEDLEVIPQAIFAAINAAHHEIRIATPYFLPDPELQSALSLAAMRGASVKLITPRHNNIPPVRWAARTIYPRLIARGVRVFESEGPFDHSKFMTVDRVWSKIGSTNWDPRSLRLNFEFDLACFDENLARELNAQFERILEGSREITGAELAAASVGERLRDGMARMFIPFL